MRVYLDHNATTPMHPAALEEMRRVLEQDHGNPSSIHREGQQARRTLDAARQRVACCLGALPEEIVFTSGGTESVALALAGVAEASGAPGHLITSAVEHQAVLNTCRQLERRGFRITWLGVDANGRVDPQAASAAIEPDTRLISLMLANNEVGSLQPVAEVAALARQRRVLCHTDAVQSLGKQPIDFEKLGVDLLSVSAHKAGGAKGVGALVIRRGVSLTAQLQGGHQERLRRAGTENLPGIAAFGMACERVRAELDERTPRLETLRDRFEVGLAARVEGLRFHAAGTARLVNTSNIGFEGLDGEALLLNLDLLGLAASNASACSASLHQPSHVLLAMGCSPVEAQAAIRFSFGPTNSAADVDRAIAIVVDAVAQMRAQEHGQ